MAAVSHDFGLNDFTTGTRNSQTDPFPPRAAVPPLPPPSFLPLESVTAGSNRPAVWQSDPHWGESLPGCLSDSKTQLKSVIHEPTLCGANSLFYGFFLRWQWWNCIAASFLLLRHQSQNICCVWPFFVFSMWLLASPLCQSEDKLLWWHHKHLLYFLFQEEKPESPSRLQNRNGDLFRSAAAVASFPRSQSVCQMFISHLLYQPKE